MNENTATEPVAVEENTSTTPVPVGDTSDDFSISMGEDTPETQEETGTQEDGEYTLDLEGLDAEDMGYADIMTTAAKEANLDASQASACFKGFCKLIREKHVAAANAEVAALKKDWGKNYESRKNDTRNFMGRLFAKAGLSPEEMQEFANPASIRLFDKIKGAISSTSIASSKGNAVPAKSEKEQLKDMLDEWSNERFSNNPDLQKLSKLRNKINTMSMKVNGVNLV